MNTNQKLARIQQKRIKNFAQQQDSLSFFNSLTGSDLFSKIESLLPVHRERLFPPTETLSMYLSQALNADRSCQRIVNEAAISRLINGLPACSTATGGYCRARQRLPLNMIASLARHTGQQIERHTPQRWQWQKKRVYLIDGTTLTMPDTAENQAAYPKHAGVKSGLGFPICRLLAVICLSTGRLLNAGIGRFNGKGSSEQTLLRSLLSSFKSDDVVLGDAYFGTYFLLAALQAKGVDAVFEQMGARKRVVDFRTGQRLGAKDHLVQWHKPKSKPEWMTQEHYDKAPKTVTIREMSVAGKVLITTFICAKTHPKHLIKDLYKSRWQIELDLRNIKTTLGMDVLSCKTPEMIEKEVWVYLLAYNLIRLLMAQSASLLDRMPRQVSFKHAVQLWIAWNHQTTVDHNLMIDFFILMGQQQAGNRPGRIEPRAVKRRPKPYPMLMVHRDDARAEVLKNGHPKKIK